MFLGGEIVLDLLFSLLCVPFFFSLQLFYIAHAPLSFQVKDAIHLLHLWLKKRELESRRVKDRDFSGIDIRELDLLPSFFLRSVRA